MFMFVLQMFELKRAVQSPTRKPRQEFLLTAFLPLPFPPASTSNRMDVEKVV